MVVMMMLTRMLMIMNRTRIHNKHIDATHDLTDDIAHGDKDNCKSNHNNKESEDYCNHENDECGDQTFQPCSSIMHFLLQK